MTEKRRKLDRILEYKGAERTPLNNDSYLSTDTAAIICDEIGIDELHETKKYFVSKIQEAKAAGQKKSLEYKIYSHTLNLLDCIEAHKKNRLELETGEGNIIEASPKNMEKFTENSRLVFSYKGRTSYLNTIHYRFDRIMSLIQNVKDIKHDSIVEKLESMHKIEMVEAAFSAIGVNASYTRRQ